MFLEVMKNTFICYELNFSRKNIELNFDNFFINLSHVSQISFMKCEESLKISPTSKMNFTYKIEFDRFVDDGVINHFTLYFIDNLEDEFVRIKNIIYKEELEMGKSGGCTPAMVRVQQVSHQVEAEEIVRLSN